MREGISSVAMIILVTIVLVLVIALMNWIVNLRVSLEITELPCLT